MKKIGVIGGGQLGLMLYQASAAFEVEVSFLDPDPNCSCKNAGADVTLGALTDADAIAAFSKDKDVLTVEIEHVSIEGLNLAREMGLAVYPSPEMLALIQDKGLQKEFYQEQEIPTAPFELLTAPNDARLEKWETPFVLKSRTGGYDGKGVQVVKARSEIGVSVEGPCLVEQMADIDKEISVIVARSPSGEIRTFPPVEMEFDPEVNLVSALISPADIKEEVASRAETLAFKLAEKLDLVGLLAVEMFLLPDGTLWVNEVAPRPHNSGHQTIEGNETSQYQQHLRSILDLPLGSTDAKGVSVMVNLLGREGHTGPVAILGAEVYDKDPKVFFHDYLKAITRPNRKMGHATVLGDTRESTLQAALAVQESIHYKTCL